MSFTTCDVVCVVAAYMCHTLVADHLADVSERLHTDTLVQRTCNMLLPFQGQAPPDLQSTSRERVTQPLVYVVVVVAILFHPLMEYVHHSTSASLAS